MPAVKYWVGFNKIPGIGRVRLGRLLDYFGDLEVAWGASFSDLKAAGLDSRSLDAFLSRRSKIDLDAEMERLERHQITVLIQDDPAFPNNLKEIYDAPPLLYVRGKLVPDDEWALAVVGTRRATPYGREVTERLVSDLAQNRMTVVSGLARGIDSVAHRAALAAGGRTIAICACGLDIIYPSENKGLAREIIENGALISDYPLGTPPKAENFPQRNRIMSGMSLGVLVIESMERGGSLITAATALQQDREVFAVPGSILSPTSRGTNALIRSGAKAVLEINDIFEELNFIRAPQQLALSSDEETLLLDDIQSHLLDQMAAGPIHIDELCRQSRLPVSQVSSTLTILELKGIVKHLGNMNYGITEKAGVL